MMFRVLTQIAKSYLAVLLSIPLGFKKEEERILKRFYLIQRNNCQISKSKTLIAMIDGRTIHGGLSDRFKGIVSLYNFAKSNGYEFKINYIYPFNLKTYLEPNKYNWYIDKNYIHYNSKYSSPILINDYEILNKHLMIQYLKHSCKRHNELHVYSNAIYGKYDFSKLFNELFRPSDYLRQNINYYLKMLGDCYISISIRFQCLLDDNFKEINNKTLSERQAKLVIEDVIQHIQLIHSKENKRILIATDSNRFVQIINNRLDYVYTIPGQIVHIDNQGDKNEYTYLKEFLDFFMIAKASKIYLLYSNLLYESGFPKRASLIYNKPFIKIKI